MSSAISWDIQLTVNEGHLDNVKELMAEMVEATKNNEPGALNYEWFMDDSESTLHVYERYEDADATMVHIGNFGQNYAERFMTYLTITAFPIYGPVTDEIKEALSPIGATFMGQVGGFAR